MTPYNRLAKTARIVAISIAVAGLSPVAHSGEFDCSLLYDEFDSLMASEFLVSPGEYVSGYEGWLSQPAFDSLQRGQFMLHPERGETGVIVFRTNQNRHGKLLYYWTDPLVDGRRYLVISEAAWYARVADGAGLELFGKLRANSGLGIDLDTGSLVAPEVEESDGEEAGTVAGDQGQDSSVVVDAMPVEEVIEAPETPTGLQVVPVGDDTGDFVVSDESVLPDAEVQPEPIPDATLPGDSADIAVLLDEVTGFYYIAAVNGATLFFPTESLCRTSPELVSASR